MSGGDHYEKPAASYWRSELGAWKSRLFPAPTTVSSSWSEPLSSCQEQRSNVVGHDQEEAWNEAVTTLFRYCNDDASKGVTKVQHIRQQQTWDCGIACLQMAAVRWLGIANCSRSFMLKQAATESIWTVDLICILQELVQCNSSFSYLFCSRTLVLNEGLQEVRYYAPAFADDRVRVTERFKLIREQGWPALQISHLPIQHVVDCIRRNNCIAIALVDNHILANASSNNDKNTYVGHYIVLAGISDDAVHLHQAAAMDPAAATAAGQQQCSYCLVVHNPGCDAKVSYLTVPHFERSWRAHGTDEDIVFLVKHNDTLADKGGLAVKVVCG